MTTGKKVLSWVTVLIVLVIAFWIIGGMFIIVDSKFRSGNVIKYGKDGWLLRTHEGTLRMGGGEGMMNIGGNEFNFSVTDEKMIKELENVDSRKTVKLWYDKTLFTLPWRGNTNYYIVRFEVMPDIYPNYPQPQLQQPQTNVPAVPQVPAQNPTPAPSK